MKKIFLLSSLLSLPLLANSAYPPMYTGDPRGMAFSNNQMVPREWQASNADPSFCANPQIQPLQGPLTAPMYQQQLNQYNVPGGAHRPIGM